MKINFCKLFLLGENRENTLKNGPRWRRSLSGPLVFVYDTKGITIMTDLIFLIDQRDLIFLIDQRDLIFLIFLHDQRIYSSVFCNESTLYLFNEPSLPSRSTNLRLIFLKRINVLPGQRI